MIQEVTTNTFETTGKQPVSVNRNYNAELNKNFRTKNTKTDIKIHCMVQNQNGDERKDN